MGTTTTLQDLIPEVVSEMASAKVVEKTALIQAGVAVGDYENVNIRDGGTTIKVPFIPEFTGDAEVLTEGTPLTASDVSADQDIGVICHRGKAFRYTTLAEIATGRNINAIIGEQLGSFWAKVYDKALLSVLKGALPNSHKLDVSQDTYGQPDVTIDIPKLIDAMNLIGDNADNFEVVIMHSKVYTDLLKNQLVQFPNSNSTEQLIRQGEFGTVLGRRIIVSDSVTSETYQLTDGTNTENRQKFYTFIAQRGAMYLGFQRDLMTEQDKDILAQTSYLVSQAHFCPHLKGVSWNTNATNPADTDLATAGNWKKVWPDKAIRVVALITN